MPYYYDRDGEIILERMQDLYYKTGLMRPDSEKEYEIHNSLGIHSKNESKLKKIVRNDSIDNSNNKNNWVLFNYFHSTYPSGFSNPLFLSAFLTNFFSHPFISKRVLIFV